jgi:hypothetical protein
MANLYEILADAQHGEAMAELGRNSDSPATTSIGINNGRCTFPRTG